MTESLISFHGKQEIKDKYLSRVIAHRKADAIIQGTGWHKGKGCAVGCTLESYDHSRYPIELGLPEWLARLEDEIFENIPKKKAIVWPEKFLAAIPVGVDVDVENVRHNIAINRMDRLIDSLKTIILYNEKLKNIFNEAIEAISIVKKCHEAKLGKKYCDWSEAWSAAESAAWSAGSEARPAKSATQSAAWLSPGSAKSAASAAWQKEAEVLLDLLSKCK